jgi:hypothetical protein
MTDLQAESKETSKTRARVYIDGFNLYFSVIKANSSWKWLNFETYFQAIRPDDVVERINYFTAIVEPKRGLSPKRDRQAIYLNALRTLKTVELIFGTYRQRSVRCGATCRQKYDTPEEKKTDVNIAIRMIDDAINGRVDRIILVSGDSDMEPAVEYIRKACPKVQMLVYIPQDPKHPHRRNNRHYQQLGAKVKPLPLNEIPQCQFPENIIHGQCAHITRPTNWK